MLRWRRRSRRRLRRAIDTTWGDTLDLVDIVQHACWEIGAHVRHLGPESEQDHRFEALTFLHARACAVAGEIDALLRAGFPSGARARWRTLHELAVTASLVGDGDDELAERYLLHTVVDEYKDAVESETTRDRSGLPPVEPAELERLKTDYEAALERFGAAFRHDWAWASPVTGTERPTFRDLEKVAQLDHLRNWYRSASHLTHAGSRGTAHIVTPVAGGHVLLAGPTNAEISGPAHAMVISLMQVTVVAALKARDSTAPHPTFLAGLRAIQMLVQEAGQAAEHAEALIDGYRAEDASIMNETGRGAERARSRRIGAAFRRRTVLSLRRHSRVMSRRWPPGARRGARQR